MPMHRGGHGQLVDQFKVDAIGLGGGVAALAVELPDAAALKGSPENRDRCCGNFQHNRAGIAGALKRRLADKSFPGQLGFGFGLAEELQAGCPQHGAEGTEF